MLPDTAAHVRFQAIGDEQICYYEKGSGSPLVLLHGMFGDFLDWEPVLEPLSAAHRVLALDLPGFGASAKPRQNYSGEFFLNALYAFLRQLQVKGATLIGNSFGGQIAMLFALRHPELVARLVLADSGGFQRYTPEEVALTEARFTEAAIAAVTPEINRLLFAGVFSQPSPASAHYLERQNAKLQRADYAAYAYAVAQSIRLSLATYVLEQVSAIRCPVLLVWGERDYVVPLALANAALAHLAHGELKIIPGCGHAPQLECPREFLQSIQPFLAVPSS